MSTSIHLLPAKDLHPVLLGEDEYVGVPFAIPLLPGLAIAAELNLTEGRLFDLDRPARVLHEQAGLCSEDGQALYVFPRLIDSSCLGRLLHDTARRTVTQAMCLDYMTVLDTNVSRLDALIPAGQFDAAPLAYMLGVVFTAAHSPAQLQLSNPRWWAQSEVRTAFHRSFAEQSSQFGMVLPDNALPCSPAPLETAFTDGLTALVASADPQFIGMPLVEFTDANTLQVSMGNMPMSPRFKFARHSLSERALETLINKLDSLGLDMAVARACPPPEQLQ